MRRKMIVSACLAAFATFWILAPGVGIAQDDPGAREITVHVVALSRGYMQPLTRTVARVSEVKGIHAVTASGFEGDVTTLKIVTSLDDDSLAAALGLKTLWRRGDEVMLAPATDVRVKRAEARLVVNRIAKAILDAPIQGPDNRDDLKPLFGEGATLQEKMATLGLSPAMLDGRYYRQSDYHIEMHEGSYRVWAGQEWEEFAEVYYRAYYSSPRDAEEPKWTWDRLQALLDESLFVGQRLYRHRYYQTRNWVDPEAIMLVRHEARRGDIARDGRLIVQNGGDYLVDLARALAAFCFHNPKVGMDDLPSGPIWVLQGGLQRGAREGQAIELPSGPEGYFHHEVYASWREEAGLLLLTIATHNVFHPYHLCVEVDITSSVKAYRESEDASPYVRRVPVDPHLRWIVGPETGSEVFVRYVDEAEMIRSAIAEAIGRKLDEHDLDSLCGRLDDEELRERLGLGWPENSVWQPGLWHIRRQLFQDVEIVYGTSRDIGRHWILMDARTGRVYRSGQ